jgi:hypothetical protein
VTTCSQLAVCSERGSHETFDSFCKIKEIHDFLCTWLSPYNTSNEHVSTEKARAKANKRSDGEDETASMSEKIADLCRATNQLFVAQEKISRLQLELGYLRLSITENSMTQTSEPEPILLRVFHNKSFCRYDPALGILCSNFAVCKPVRGIGELKTRAELTEATLRNHCGGDSATSFISLTNSIGYLRNYISGQRRSHYSSPRSSAMVAFVNKAKLDYMEIFCATSRSLAEEVGARYWSKYNPDGVSYASKEHFMVYGWIPPQCIEKVVSLADLERTRSWILAAANGNDGPTRIWHSR